MKYKSYPIDLISIETHPHLKNVSKLWTAGELFEEYTIYYDKIHGWEHYRILRIDNKPIHNFMDIQKIKNDLIGREKVAIQVFPKQSDFIDGSNTYHIWTKENLKVPNLKRFYKYNNLTKG